MALREEYPDSLTCSVDFFSGEFDVEGVCGVSSAGERDAELRRGDGQHLTCSLTELCLQWNSCHTCTDTHSSHNTRTNETRNCNQSSTYTYMYICKYDLFIYFIHFLYM